MNLKTELLAVLLEFDYWWRESGTKIELDGKPTLMKPSLTDFTKWLDGQVENKEDEL